MALDKYYANLCRDELARAERCLLSAQNYLDQAIKYTVEDNRTPAIPNFRKYLQRIINTTRKLTDQIMFKIEHDY